jgi:DNA primase
MAIPSETIDQVRMSTDIVELVREYIPTLKKVGRNWKANCPFHHEKTPSFIISADKGIFHCFGCHVGGDAFKFTMLMDNLSWPEAVRKLAAKSGITIRETTEELVKRTEKQKVFDLLENFAEVYKRCLSESPEAAAARQYLKKRGVTQESIEKFSIGFAPRNTAVVIARKKNISADSLAEAGIVTKGDGGRRFEYMSGRIVFPIFDVQGRVIAFGGRAMGDDQPKYLNSPESSVYSKSRELYGLFQAAPTLRHNKEAIVLEGYMDVVVSHQFGVTNTVASCGTALTAHQARLLNRYAEKILLLFDSDFAGKEAAKNAIETLAETDTLPRVASLPADKDPDEYLLENGVEKFYSYLTAETRSSMEFLVEHFTRTFGDSSPDQRVRIVGEILPILDKIKNTILKSEWIKFVSLKLRVSEDALQQELYRWTKLNRKYENYKENEFKALTRIVRNIEEEMLQIICQYPELAAEVDKSVFKDARNQKIFGMISEGTVISDISKNLEEAETAWFTELVLEEKVYSYPRQVLAGLVRNLECKDLECKRKVLEREVIEMINGTVPFDNNKVETYKDLNRQLKGSAKV